MMMCVDYIHRIIQVLLHLPVVLGVLPVGDAHTQECGVPPIIGLAKGGRCCAVLLAKTMGYLLQEADTSNDNRAY